MLTRPDLRNGKQSAEARQGGVVSQNISITGKVRQTVGRIFLFGRERVARFINTRSSEIINISTQFLGAFVLTFAFLRDRIFQRKKRWKQEAL